MRFRHWAVWPVISVTICAAAVAEQTDTHARPADFYVATNGDDENPGTKAKPFATLSRARDAVRGRIVHGLTGDVTVHIRGGVYRVSEPVVFGPLDSGTDAHAITYGAYPGEKPVISGGRAIKNWTKNADGTWRAIVPDVTTKAWYFRELFVNGRRSPRARHPNKGYLRVLRPGRDGRTALTFRRGDVRAADHAPELEAVYLHSWSISRAPVKAIDERSARMRLGGKIGGPSSMWRIRRRERYFLESSPSYLDAPGEWYLSRLSGVLTYRPMRGQTVDRIEAIAPVARQLLVVRGDADGGRPVKNLHFVGLSFEHCAWLPPTGRYAGGQACYHWSANDNAPIPGAPAPSAVLFECAESCSLENGTIAHIGCSGVWFGRSCRDNRFVGNYVTDIAGNGVMVGEGQDRRPGGKPWWEAAAHEAASGNVLTNNLVEYCGQQFFGAVGIWIGMANKTTVAHNEVRQLPYGGISVGWMWTPVPTPCGENQITDNHIHHVMRTLFDSGGIYTLGRQPGTVIRGNCIHDVFGLPRGRINNGIFFDQGSTDILAEHNVIFDVVNSPIRFHDATTNMIRNNVLVTRHDVQPFSYARTNRNDITRTDNTVVRTRGPGSALPPDVRRLIENAKAASGSRRKYRGARTPD